MGEEYKILIAESDNDRRDTIFASYNGKSIAIPVGEEVWIPKMFYTAVLSKGNLKGRVSKLDTRPHK